MAERDRSRVASVEHRRINLYLTDLEFERLAKLASRKGYASPTEIVRRFIAFGERLCEQEERVPQNGDFYVKSGDEFTRPTIL